MWTVSQGSTSTRGVDKPQPPWYTYIVQHKHIMFTDETVALVTVSIPSRTFNLFSDMGNEKVITCETIDQFQQVLKLVRANSERVEISYDY